ncbi:MAG: EAL domain-containing protein [Oscillospiraceae bacterium]
MIWHVDAEIICFLLMLVITIDVMKSNAVRTQRDKIFITLAFVTIVAIFVDALSSAAMMRPDTAPWWLTQGSLMAYFILMPLLSVLWQVYAIVVVEKRTTLQKTHIRLTVLPMIPYVLLVLTNPATSLLFELTAESVYSRGILFPVTYLLFYGYSLATLVLAVVNFRRIERTTSVVLMVFPVIAGIGILLQQLFYGYLVMGAAFTLVLLITYLFLQNRKATRDSLTGVNNRQSFAADIEKIGKKGERGFVLTASLDDFKFFNQTFGQKNGDILLRKVAEYFVSISRDKTVYRYGGDTFALILKKASKAQVVALADKIQVHFQTPISMDNTDYAITACLGVVEYPYNSQRENWTVISAMDFAIFQAKKLGKGQLAFFDEALMYQFERKHQISDAITRAMEQNAFEVYIQPIYHLREKRFLFSEALLRLHDPVLGDISPAEFIPIAEETGQIVELTYFVLERVCAFLKDNRAILRDEVSVSVNFSVIQFMQSNMVERVEEIVRRYEIPAKLLKIEVTESVVIDSFEDLQGAMEQLCSFGMTFALDDYGQGYSNISYLINLPFSIVKLDKSVIDHIASDSTVISALIPMFRSLGKTIVAEGVEDKAQSDVLEKLHCDTIQGFYYARPMQMGKALDSFKMMDKLPPEKKSRKA